MEDSAIVTFIESFSASRLKGRCALFVLSFSLSFFLSLEEPKKEEPDLDEDLTWLND